MNKSFDISKVTSETYLSFVHVEACGSHLCILCNDGKKWDRNCIKRHVKDYHLKTHVEVQGRYLYLCLDKSCCNEGHYHCLVCEKPFKKNRVKKHVESQHKGKSVETSDVVGVTDSRTIKKVKKVKCHVCNEEMYARNLKIHQQRKHGGKKHVESYKYNGICIHAEEGLYLVTEHLSGIQKPIHVVKKIATNGEQKFFCESKPCRATRDAACRSGLLINYECIHLEAVKHVTNTADATNLNNDSLGKLVSEHIISEDTKAQLQQLKNDARCNSAPLVVLWESQPRDSQRYLFVSVRDTSVHNYSLTGRVLVTVDMEKKLIRCNCSSGRRGCLHKAVTKWCLAKKSLLFIESVQNDDDDLQFSEWSETAAALGESRDTNADDDLKKLATYWLHEKHIPFSIPREFLQINHHPGMVVSASEEHCYFCEPDLISLEPSDGYIITFKSLVRGIKVEAKSCPGCKMNYWPQDYKTGLLNFNNSIFISLELLVFLRSGLMEHTAIGRSLNILERLHGHKIKHHTVIKAYFMYDAFSRNSHSFSCNDCGQHPAIMNFDVNRKAAFRMPKLSLEKDKSYSDKVNVKAFWERVFLAAICDGVFYEKMNPYAVDPNFENWAPWMAPEMLKENDCLNTEYKKLSDDVDDSEINILHNLTEERLEQLLLKGTREELAELCQSCKITSKCRTKLDMVLALKSAIQANAQVDKFFFKIFHASGGVLIGTCPHGISLSIKWLLRAESPRDSTDLLLSMKYPPNVVLSDVPHMLAAHTNKRQTDFFYPNSGRVVSDTKENVEKALDGSLPNQTFPWLKRMHEPCLEKYYLEKPRMGKVHPITLVQSRYSLYDPFHEGNTTQAKEVLRRTGFVKELNGVLNRETAEQMNRIVSKDVYFLDEMLPRHHMQMMLSLLGCRNVQKNKEFDQLLVNSFGEQFTLKLDPFGRRLLENICGSGHGDKESPTISAATNITLQSIVPSKAFWTDVPQGYIDGFSADSELPCSHFIFTDASPFKIRREDILTLLPGDDVGRDVDGNVLDMLLLLCGAVASLHGINVRVLPSHFLASLSWDLSQECLIPDSFENVHCMFTLSSRPGHWCLTGFDKRCCKIIYLDPLGRDISSNQIALQHVQIVKTLVWRYVLYNDLDCPEDLDAHGWGLVTARNFMEEFNSPLPMQLCSTDCGIFSLMYGLYIMQFSRFDFSQSDMVKIRYQLFRIICNCSNDPRLVTYISHTTTGSWPLFERDGGGGGDDGGGGGGGDDGGGGGGGDDQFGLHIDVLPNEILGQIFLFLCLDNASEKSVLKLVCRRWLKCLDTAFDNRLYEKRLLLKINEAKSRYKFRHILEDSIKACEWLLKNHMVLKKKPSLPLMLTTNDSFLKEIEDLVRFDEQPRPDEAAGIDPEFLYDWVTDRIRRIHEAREFEFYAMEDMVRFLAETDVEVSAKCVT